MESPLLRKIPFCTHGTCWRALFWSTHLFTFSCRFRGTQGSWPGREGTLLCCRLLARDEPLITIPAPSDTKFYEQFAVLGRTTDAVRKRLYVLFPDGMSEAKIREKMRESLKDWHPAAAGTDAMVAVEQPVAAPLEVGAKGASQGRSGTGRFARKRSAQDVAGSAGQLDDPASKVGMGA